MYNMIEKYMNNLTKENFNLLANKKNIFFSNEELEFSFNFIKKNWNQIFSNPASFDITKYKNNFTNDNFIKIKNLYIESLNKYGHYFK